MPNFAENNEDFMGMFPDSGPSAAEPGDMEAAGQNADPASEGQDPRKQQEEPDGKPIEEAADGEPTVRRRGRKKKLVTDDAGAVNEVGHFSCICDASLIAQVRAIAWKERMTVRSVVERMFSRCIAKYERKHGPIQTGQGCLPDDLF